MKNIKWLIVTMLLGMSGGLYAQETVSEKDFIIEKCVGMADAAKVLEKLAETVFDEESSWECNGVVSQVNDDDDDVLIEGWNVKGSFLDEIVITEPLTEDELLKFAVETAQAWVSTRLYDADGIVCQWKRNLAAGNIPELDCRVNANGKMYRLRKVLNQGNINILKD